MKRQQCWSVDLKRGCFCGSLAIHSRLILSVRCLFHPARKCDFLWTVWRLPDAGFLLIYHHCSILNTSCFSASACEDFSPRNRHRRTLQWLSRIIDGTLVSPCACTLWVPTKVVLPCFCCYWVHVLYNQKALFFCPANKLFQVHNWEATCMATKFGLYFC